jgi:uracil-DNA glycosylase family 4
VEADLSWARLERAIVRCRRCPRLVAHREAVAREKRRQYRDEAYWGRPVPGFGDRRAGLLVVGLAPAAHGGNRTGRVFTGDRSGDWLYAALHSAGFASQPTSTHRDDGLELRRAWVSAAARCAPPDNKPTPGEFALCRDYLVREMALLQPTLRVVVALGGLALDNLLRAWSAAGHPPPRPRPRFGHAAESPLSESVTLLCSYHPSQQNTFTGRLTRAMLEGVFTRAAVLIRMTKDER